MSQRESRPEENGAASHNSSRHHNNSAKDSARGAAFGISAGFRCPDCSGATVAGRLNHDETCPVGRGIDAATAGDRDWFAAHPEAHSYDRDLTWSELVEFALIDGLPYTPAGGRVMVVQFAPGVRARTNVFYVCDGSESR